MKNKQIITIIALCILPILQVIAQDYSKQVNAFAKSFADKNPTAIREHISPELKFDPIPLANTPVILTNIVTNLPKLNSITILESKKGKAKIKYDFEGLGIRESSIFFDSHGKITRIELIENLIKQEMEAQKRMQQSVQLPTPGELGSTYMPQKVEFPASDGLVIQGNLYEVNKEKPVILLCHQAGYNRIEYADIAPQLNELGYNCLAVDLRSGGNFAGKSNNTNKRALEKGLQPEMVDAQQDITAAVAYLNKKYKKDIIVWGSSFSSSLALIEGAQNTNIKAIIGFSPGDYFGTKAVSLKTIFPTINKPFLVTSSREEAVALGSLIDSSQLQKNQLQFVPQSEGFHGSRALWTGQKGAEEYWKAVSDFLATL